MIYIGVNRHPTWLWDAGSLVGIFGSLWWTIMTFIAYFLDFPEGTSHVFFKILGQGFSVIKSPRGIALFSIVL